MKEVILFIKWQWKRWELWQRCYIVGAFFFGVGLGLPSPYRNYVMVVPVVMLFLAIAKWFMIDPIRSSWEKYKKEKSGLFEVIKGE